jgi:hypothetical protein
MPTIMTHAVVAWGLGRVLTRFRRLPAHLWLLAAGLAMFPDLDVLAGPLGIPWGSPWAHRGLHLARAGNARERGDLGLAAARHSGDGRLAGERIPGTMTRPGLPA